MHTDKGVGLYALTRVARQSIVHWVWRVSYIDRKPVIGFWERQLNNTELPPWVFRIDGEAHTSRLPRKVQHWLGMVNSSGRDLGITSLVDMNDYCKTTFTQIADHVEKYQELLFVNNGT